MNDKPTILVVGGRFDKIEAEVFWDSLEKSEEFPYLQIRQYSDIVQTIYGPEAGIIFFALRSYVSPDDTLEFMHKLGVSEEFAQKYPEVLQEIQTAEQEKLDEFLAESAQQYEAEEEPFNIMLRAPQNFDMTQPDLSVLLIFDAYFVEEELQNAPTFLADIIYGSLSEGGSIRYIDGAKTEDGVFLLIFEVDEEHPDVYGAISMLMTYDLIYSASIDIGEWIDAAMDQYMVSLRENDPHEADRISPNNPVLGIIVDYELLELFEALKDADGFLDSLPEGELYNLIKEMEVIFMTVDVRDVDGTCVLLLEIGQTYEDQYLILLDVVAAQGVLYDNEVVLGDFTLEAYVKRITEVVNEIVESIEADQD